MQYQFDERIELATQKAVKQTLRFFKGRLKGTLEGGSAPSPPSYEEFLRVIQQMIESGKMGDLKRLRTPSLRDLFEKTWSQKLRNYATQKQFRDAYEALLRRL